MTETVVFICARTIICLSVLYGLLLGQSCQTSIDCEDRKGRTLCYQKLCRRDVPCNKDNDCFFFGAADVSVGFPHPRCYINPYVHIQSGYGICMLAELAGTFVRVQGNDVLF